MKTTQDAGERDGGGTRRLQPWVIVAIVVGVALFVLPVLAIVAVTFLGSAAETEFSQVGSSIG